jgi:HAD superfamily hydrolase (TIGR01509 family)
VTSRPAVRQLVWDMDGTLLDSSVVVPAAYLAAVRRLGGPDLTPAQVVESYSVGTPEMLLAHLLGRKLAAGEPEAYYDQLSAVTARAYPGVEEVLTALRVRGHRVAVFTGASSRAATMLLATAGIAVDVLVGGDEVARPKPAADGLLLMGRRLGIAASDLAYIGDAPNDLRAATAAGGIGVAASWGHQYQSSGPADVTLAAPAEALALLDGRDWQAARPASGTG